MVGCGAVLKTLLLTDDMHVSSTESPRRPVLQPDDVLIFFLSGTKAALCTEERILECAAFSLKGKIRTDSAFIFSLTGRRLLTS